MKTLWKSSLILEVRQNLLGVASEAAGLCPSMLQDTNTCETRNGTASSTRCWPAGTTATMTASAAVAAGLA
jgi:hypothetical protein